MKLFIALGTAIVLILSGTIWLMTPPYVCSSDAALPSHDPSESADYADYVGWYRYSETDHILVTWGASGGLRLIDFAQPALYKLIRESSDTFRIAAGPPTSTATISFSRDDTGTVRTLSASGGDSGIATKADSFGYEQTQVAYRNGTARLAGTLLTPVAEGPHPGVVIIHGSGLSDRDNLWYWTIVDRLARSGTAVLFPDKRGAGSSTGNWCMVDFTDLANDALAGLRLLQEQNRIDSREIGVLGVSQGGWIAPIAARLADDVAFLITVSSAAVGPMAQFRHETRHTLEGEYGLPSQAARLLTPVVMQVSTSKNRVWWDRVKEFTPLPYWSELRQPALAIFGKGDLNVPVEASVTRLNQLIADDPETDISIQVYANSGHGILDPQTGWIREGFLDLLVEWISVHASGP